MHPLAGERSIATMDVDVAPTAPSVPKPMDIEALRTQLHQWPSLEKPAPTAEASRNPDPIAARIHMLPGECHNIPPPVQVSHSSSPSIAQPVSDLTMPAVEQAQFSTAVQQSIPAESTSLSHMPPGYGHRRLIKFSRKRYNDSSRVKAVGRDAHADALGTDAREAIIEKTRLVEQLDLTTRKIINEKDEKITELEAQV